MGPLPYLHFQGDCAAAMAFYAEVFGAGPPATMRYAEAPGADAAALASDRLIHAEITIGTGKLMASDFPPGVAGAAQASVSVMCPVTDAAEGQRIYDRLADGGAAIAAFGPTFWSGGFGMVKDRFGTHWIIAAP